MDLRRFFLPSIRNTVGKFVVLFGVLFLGAAFFAFQGITSYAATEYHVDANIGVDSASCGTVASPCKTIQFTVNKGLVAGDTVTIHAGTYRERVAIPFTRRGTASSPITIQGAPSENRDGIIIDGTGLTEAVYSAGSVGSGGGSSQGTEYLVLKHFHVISGSNHGILLDMEHHFNTLSDILIDGLNQTGGLTGSKPDSAISIMNGGNSNTMDGIRIVGPASQAQVVAFNLISGNSIVRNSYAENIRGNFVMSSSKSNNLYEYNEVRNSSCNYDDGCIQVYNSTNVIIRYNVFSNVSSLNDYEAVIGIRRTDLAQRGGGSAQREYCRFCCREEQYF